MSERYDRYEHVGQKCVNVDVDGGSPFARCIIPAEADAKQFIADVAADVERAFRSRCLAVEFSTSIFDEPRPVLHPTFGRDSEGEIIQPKEVEDAKWRAIVERPPPPPVPPEVIEAERAKCVAALQAMTIRELAYEKADSCGGTSYDELLNAEIERRDRIWSELAQVPA